jgi:antitoxin component YwqK of YwqJK toxin-antitoxin module
MGRNRVTLYVFMLMFFWLACGTKKRHDNKETGKLRTELSYKNGKKEGEAKLYDLNENLVQTQNWKEGKLDGLVQTFYENGILKSEIMFKSGKKNGLAKEYDQYGNLLEVENYHNDVLNGSKVSLNKKGDTLRSGYLQNGLLNGPYKEFYPSGLVKTVRYFVNDTAHYRKDYNKKGEISGYNFPIIIEVDSTSMDSVEIKFSIPYSNIQNPRLGLIIGTLNENGELMDTTDILSNKGLELSYRLDPEYKLGTLSGLLFEIDDSSGKYELFDSFEYPPAGARFR